LCEPDGVQPDGGWLDHGSFLPAHAFQYFADTGGNDRYRDPLKTFCNMSEIMKDKIGIKYLQISRKQLPLESED
jgi:hypothetical protein